MSTQSFEQQATNNHARLTRMLAVGVAIVILGAVGFVSVRLDTPAAASARASVPHALGASTFLSLNATGVTGEGSGGTGSIEISSFSFGASNATATGSAKAGKVRFNELTVTKKIDSASPLFFRNCVTGQHYKNVTLYMQPTAESIGDSMTINLGNVFVSGINWGDTSGAQPMESLSFSFTTVQVTYNKQSRVG